MTSTIKTHSPTERDFFHLSIETLRKVESLCPKETAHWKCSCIGPQNQEGTLLNIYYTHKYIKGLTANDSEFPATLTLKFLISHRMDASKFHPDKTKPFLKVSGGGQGTAYSLFYDTKKSVNWAKIEDKIDTLLDSAHLSLQTELSVTTQVKAQQEVVESCKDGINKLKRIIPDTKILTGSDKIILNLECDNDEFQKLMTILKGVSA